MNLLFDEEGVSEYDKVKLRLRQKFITCMLSDKKTRAYIYKLIDN